MARVAVTRAPSPHGVTAVSLQDAAGPGAGCCRQPCANNNGPVSETLLAPGSPDNTGQLTLAPRRRQRAPPPGEQQRRHPTPMEGKEIHVVCLPHVIFKSLNLRGALCVCVLFSVFLSIFFPWCQFMPVCIWLELPGECEGVTTYVSHGCVSTK
ncbi:hypothetical protein TcCL_NonESM12772 [Trypanosoma cruzi]|nr:hypothetical protein TcCL_NonESM12772 [Trypanosoma cruzi]